MITSKAAVTALILLSAGYAGGNRSFASSLRTRHSSSSPGGTPSHRQQRHSTQKPKTPAPVSTVVPKPKVPPTHSHPVVPQDPPVPPPPSPVVTPGGSTTPPPAPPPVTPTGAT